MKETQRMIMFRARQSALAKSYKKTTYSSFFEKGEKRDIETLAKSLAGKKKR